MARKDMARKCQEIEYVSLKNDLLFHMVFTRNGRALKGLLSTLLNLPESDILSVEILNPMQYSDVIDSRLTVLDIKVHLNGDTFVLVEIQVRRFGHWTNRTLTYACRQMADQVHGNFDYSKLEPVIQVSIMNHTLFPEHPRFFARYVPRDDEGYLYTDKLQFYVMDLTQTDAATSEQEGQGLVEWAQAFKADSWDKVHRIGNPGIKEAVKTMELIMSNPTERDLIRARMDAEIDHRTLMLEAEARGRAEGKVIGEARGKAIGIADAHKQDAFRMKEVGMSIDLISSITGLSLEEITEL